MSNILSVTAKNFVPRLGRDPGGLFAKLEKMVMNETTSIDGVVLSGAHTRGEILKETATTVGLVPVLAGTDLFLRARDLVKRVF